MVLCLKEFGATAMRHQGVTGGGCPKFGPKMGRGPGQDGHQIGEGKAEEVAPEPPE